MNIELDSLEVEYTVECKECGEEHSHTISPYVYGSYDSDHSEHETECDCGAKMKVSWGIRINLDGEFTPAPPKPEVFEGTLPGPNQIDMFTGQTIGA